MRLANMAVTGVAALMAVVALAGCSTGRPAQVGSSAPGGWPAAPTGTRLVYGSAVGPFYVLDVDRRQGSSVALPTGYSASQYREWETGPLWGQFAAVAEWVVFSVTPRNGAAPSAVFVLPANLSGSPRVLLRSAASTGVFAALRPGAIWVGQDLADQHRRAVEIDVATGRTVTVSAPFDQTAYPIAEVPAGLLTTTENPGGNSASISVVDPHTAAVVRTVATDATTNQPVLGVSGATVAWQQSGNCSTCDLHLTNVTTGADRTIASPPGQWQCDSGAFSANGAHLAVGYDCPRNTVGRGGDLLLVTTANGHSNVVADSGDSQTNGGPFWNTSGDWIFWQGQTTPNGYPATLAYQLGTPHPVRFGPPNNVASDGGLWFALDNNHHGRATAVTIGLCFYGAATTGAVRHRCQPTGAARKSVRPR